MLTKVAIAKKLAIPSDKAWEAIGKIGRLDVWFPTIATCRVEGDGIGAHRYMTLNRGGDITDRIVEIDQARRRLTYQRVRSPFPVSSYKGTVEVFESFDSRAIVVWTVDFESEPKDSASVAEALQAGIGAGVDGLEKDLQSETGELPDLAAQVRPLVQALPRASQPRLIAELERAAAERYQAWAASCPEPTQAEGLRDCATREQEVARRVEVLFPPQTDERRDFSDALPKIAEAYRLALAHRSVNDQYAIQAAAERRGAEFWRSLATSLSDPAARKVLASCAELEERSAEFLEALLTPKP